MAAGILAVLLVAAPALADVTGPARVIDGDTLDIAGERIRLRGCFERSEQRRDGV